MDYIGYYVMAFIEMGGLFAPLLFISFHLLRPLLFLPVVFICISGGILFGPVAGTIYSLIGITLSSMIFYVVIRRMPKTVNKLFDLKRKLIGKRTELTTSQISLLRLIPFIHFHLLSLCLIEVSTGFREYTRNSLLSNIPLAFVYTTIGGWISNLSSIHILLFLLVFLPLLYFLRKKEFIITWREFFQVST